jgi:hypothetical protein
VSVGPTERHAPREGLARAHSRNGMSRPAKQMMPRPLDHRQIPSVLSRRLSPSQSSVRSCI